MSLLKLATAVDAMALMVDSSDHVTGKTGATLTVTASKNGAAFASISPTVTERGNGWYSVSLTASHTDTLGALALHATAAGADPSDLSFQVLAGLPGETVTLAATTHTGAVIPIVSTLTGHTPQTGDSFARIGAPAGASVSEDVAAVKAETASIQGDTNDVQARLPAALSGGKMDSSFSGTMTANLIGNITGNVSGSVGSVTGNVGGDVVGTVGGVVGNITGDLLGSVEEVLGSVESVTLPVLVATAIKPIMSAPYPNFMFPMFDSVTKAPKTGLAVSAQRSINGAAFVACTNSPSEVGSGIYKIDLDATDMDGEKIMLRFGATGANDQFVEVFTQS